MESGFARASQGFLTLFFVEPSIQHAYDVIVVGLGVMGSAAAYHLAKRGQRVLALEQFDLDHQMGSSYGESRIIRYAYTHPLYVQMAHASFAAWQALQDTTGLLLMRNTGGIDFGPPDSASLTQTIDTLRSEGIPFEELTEAQIAKWHPLFNLQGQRVIYQPDYAYLAASRGVIALAQLANKHGATIRTRTPIKGIEAYPNKVRVHTADATYEAGALIIAAGSWSGKWLAALDLTLPLQPTREQVVFFRGDDESQTVPGKFPIFISHSTPWFYGLPNVDGNGIKIGVHCNGENTDPDNTNHTPDRQYIEKVTHWAQQVVPGAKHFNNARVCLYTMTPDEHFILDSHPTYPHISFMAGCSGHGFKFGPVIGKILADLAQGRTPDFDLGLFRAERFLAAT
jgi:monomeric sarcosine oxidase